MLPREAPFINEHQYTADLRARLAWLWMCAGNTLTRCARELRIPAAQLDREIWSWRARCTPRRSSTI